MIGRFLLPQLSPIWAWLNSLSNAYGVTQLSYRLVMGLTFFLTLVFMSLQMYILGAVFLLLHFITLAVLRFSEKDDKNKEAKALHIYGFCALTTYALIFGTREDFGMPVAFLFLSWIILSLTNMVKSDRFQLIGGFEIGAIVMLISLFPDYIPAIAILSAIACFMSAGITMMVGLKNKN